MKVTTSFEEKDVFVELRMTSKEAQRIIDILKVGIVQSPQTDKNFIFGLKHFLGLKNFLP